MYFFAGIDKFFGSTITSIGIFPDPERVKAISEYKLLKTA